MARRAPRLETLWISSNPLGATPPWFPEVSPSALEPEFVRERDAAVTLRSLPSHARALDLTDAALSHVPDLTARAACLTTLKLARNHLGFLPAHLSDCVALRVLHLDENRLSFLPDLSKMTRLEDLRARANRLVTLTPSVSKLTNLASLYVGRNPLTSIPDVSTCANLETLWIAECRLVALPLSLADAPRLANFYCEGNPLKFPAPEVYARGGNDEVLRYLRNVAETERERRDMERFRKEMHERRAFKSRRASRQETRTSESRAKTRGNRGEETAPRVFTSRTTRLRLLRRRVFERMARHRDVILARLRLLGVGRRERTRTRRTANGRVDRRSDGRGASLASLASRGDGHERRASVRGGW